MAACIAGAKTGLDMGISKNAAPLRIVSSNVVVYHYVLYVDGAAHITIIA